MKKLPKTINITLKVWRQPGAQSKGHFETIPVNNVSVHMSFIEVLDTVNEQLTLGGKDPIAFDNDCREGICGMCGTMVDGRAHGAEKPLPCASCICESFQTAIRLSLNRFEPKHLRWLRIWWLIAATWIKSSRLEDSYP